MTTVRDVSGKRGLGWLAVILGALLWLWPWAPLSAQGIGSGNLLGRVIEECPRPSDPVAYQALEKQVLGSLRWMIRRGEVRDALAVAEALEACRRRQARATDFDPAQTPPLLREIHCFLPLVLFEQQHQVDPAIAKRALEICPAPPDAPPSDGGERTVRLWGERVRRHLLLLAFAEEPASVFSKAMARIDVLRRTGLWKEVPLPDFQEASEGGEVPSEPGSEEGDEEGEEPEGPPTCLCDDEGPVEEEMPAPSGPPDEEDPLVPFGIQNPLLTAQVLAVVASMAQGRAGDLAQVLGGEEGLCRSPLVEGVALIQQVLPSQTSALRLAQSRLLSTSVMGAVVGLVEELAGRFRERKECATAGNLALLAVQALTKERTASLAAQGETSLLARLWRHVDASIPVSGGPAERQAVLARLAAMPDFPGQDLRRCEWSRMLLTEGRPRTSLEVIRGKDADCAVPLRLWAWVAIESERRREERGASAAIRAWLARSPDHEEVLRLLEEVEPEEVQRHLVRRLGRHVASAGSPVAERRAVIRALLKLADKAPGTPLAEAAMTWVQRARGWAEDPGEEVMRDLVATRHHLEGGRIVQARAAYRSALARIRPSMEQAVHALWMVTVQLLHEGRDSWVREAKSRLVALVPADSNLLVAAALEMARRGMRDPAIQVLHGATERARREGRSPQVLAALADAWLLLNRPEEARQVLGSLGERVQVPDMLQARQALAEKDYRKALGILGRVLDDHPDDPDVRYQRALARMLAGRAEEAEEDLRTILRRGSRNKTVLGALGYAQFDQGHYDEAERTFREALSLDEEEPDNLLGLALSLFRLGRIDEAREIWMRNLRTHPLFGDGIEAAEAAGYSYTEFQRSAWREFLEALESSRRDGPRR